MPHIAFYESVIENFPIGSNLVTPTPQARILAVNDAFLRTTDRKREDLVGISVFDAFPANPDDLEDTGVEALRNSLARVIATGKPDMMAVQRYPIRVTRSDGKEQFEERYWSATNTPIYDGDGTLVCIMHTSIDITTQVKAEAALRNTANRLQFALESAEIGDWDFDLVTGQPSRSLRHDQCFGYNDFIPDWGLEKFIEHVHPDDRARISDAFETAVSELKDWHIECRVMWPDESQHWIAIHGRVQSTDGKAVRMAGIIQDITDRKQAEEELRHASLHDPLTGLPNRAMLFECASHLIPYNKRLGQSTAVMFIDLDRFKPINDTHGHEVGDVVLKEAASRLSSHLRAADLVIRLGGDEFVVLLQNSKGPSSVAEVARQLVEKINQPYLVGDLTLSLSASIGISMFPDDGEDIDTLMSHADMAMYQAKQEGRNNFQFYSSEFAAGTRLQMVIEERLQHALHSDSFYLCYQPVLDVTTKEIVSVEALLRWHDSDIGPERFVPVAETTGIINPIGRWLLREASRQHKKWKAHGLPAIPIAINVSVVEFRDKNFVSRFNTIIREYDIDTSAVQLELTETTMMDDVEYAVTALSELKALGVKVLLDDFGTGHSSLAYIARLPLHKIKIDKSFISRLENDVASRAVTEAMIAIGRTLNLEIVAEGIESASALEYACSHGCGQAQGFFIARPMSGDMFEHWYRKRGQELNSVSQMLMACH